MVKRLLIAFSLTFLVCSLPASGRNFLSLEGEGPRETVTLTVGEVNVFQISGVERVSVRNPEIVDISRVRDNEVIVVARQLGNTVLTIWSRGQKEEFYILVHQKELGKAESELKELIHDNLGIRGVRFRKNEVAGQIMVIGEVNSYEKAQVDQVLENFRRGLYGIHVDNYVTIAEETKMVEIEAHIFELTKGAMRGLGFDWPDEVTLRAPEARGSSLSDVFRIADWSRDGLALTFQAYLTEGKGKVLARPKILCLSGEEADFLVGGEIPIVTQSATAAGDVVSQDIEYKDYGVKLNIRPVVLRDGSIKIELNTEVSDLSGIGAYQFLGTSATAFITRRMSSVLRLREGQAIIMSGLLQDRVTKDDMRQVPGLGSVPILGALFRSRDYQKDQTELVISLVPRVIDVREEVFDSVTSPKEPDFSFAAKPLIHPAYLRQDPGLENYALTLQRRIVRSLVYPRLAREAGWHGQLKLRLHLDYTGNLLDAAISESSGYITFDREVLSMAKSLSPYPPFPSDIETEKLWVEIPVIFRSD